VEATPLNSLGACPVCGRGWLRVEPVAAAGRTKRTTNMTLWLIILTTLALSLIAAARVRSVYSRYNQGAVLSLP
jgi:hypothetical protein